MMMMMIYIYSSHSTAAVGLGLLVEVSRSHSGEPHFVGLLGTSDKPNAETFIRQHTQLSQVKDFHTLGRI